MNIYVHIPSPFCFTLELFTSQSCPCIRDFLFSTICVWWDNQFEKILEQSNLRRQINQMRSWWINSTPFPEQGEGLHRRKGNGLCHQSYQVWILPLCDLKKLCSLKLHLSFERWKVYNNTFPAVRIKWINLREGIYQKAFWYIVDIQ